MDAAEDVFVADSTVVSAQLRCLPDTGVDPAVLAALGMVSTAAGFLGSLEAAMRWLLDRPAPGSADRAQTAQVTRLVLNDTQCGLPGWTGELTQAWKASAAALAAYRDRLPVGIDTDAVLESLLHMHHNRVVGIDRDAETTSRRMARQAAQAWYARSTR